MSTTRYKITLQTLGPVHIGSGETLTKTDFIFNINNEHVQFINKRKLIKFLQEKNLITQYTKYLMNNTASRANLFFFFKDHRIHPREWNHIVSYEVMAYRRTAKKYINEINEFVKDGRNDMYIPGSSLKGVLRSIFALDIKNQDDEKKFMSKIKVYDSPPITKKSFAIYQKYDVGKKVRTISMFRECLKPNVSVEMDFTVEDDTIDLATMKEKIADFYKSIYNKHISGFEGTVKGEEYFDEGLIDDQLDPLINDQVIFLGGGVGFVSKTDYYQVYEKEKAKAEVLKELAEKYPLYRKFKKPQNVPIVLKTTRDTMKNQPFLFGPCKIEIEKIGEY